MSDEILYPDMCQECDKAGRYQIYGPLRIEACDRDSDYITADYICNYGHQWNCRWARQERVRASEEVAPRELPVWARGAAKIAYESWHQEIAGAGRDAEDIIPPLPWDEVPGSLKAAWIVAVCIAHNYINGYVSARVAVAVSDPRGEQLWRTIAALGQIASGDNAGCDSPQAFAAVVLADIAELDQ